MCEPGKKTPVLQVPAGPEIRGERVRRLAGDVNTSNLDCTRRARAASVATASAAPVEELQAELRGVYRLRRTAVGAHLDSARRGRPPPST